MFHNSTPVASSRAARSDGSASPPHRARFSGRPDQGVSSSNRQVAGVACITVAAVRRISSSSAVPSCAVSRLAMTTVAPITRGRKSSKAAMSNEIVVTASSTSRSVRPGLSCIESKRFAREIPGTATPFGLPVEPEV